MGFYTFDFVFAVGIRIAYVIRSGSYRTEWKNIL